MTNDSQLTIAKALGKGDHTTVINSVKRIENEIKSNSQTRNTLEILRKKLSAG